MSIDIHPIDPQFLEEDDRIVSYLKGKMSEEEERLFMEELQANPELKARAIATARLVKGLKEVGAEQDKLTRGAFLASSLRGVETAARMATNHAEAAYMEPERAEREYARKAVVKTQKEGVSPKKSPSRRKTFTWMSAAASLLLIVWLGIGYNNYRNTTSLGKTYEDAFRVSYVESPRGSETSSEAAQKLKALFLNVVESKNMKETIRELSLCWELSNMETYNDYTDFSAEIGWQLAIAHLKHNDRKSARQVLEKLIATTEDGSAINEKAKELLEKL